MAPWYAEVCKDLGWTVDEALLSTMKANNTAALAKLDETIEDAEKNLGEMEVHLYSICLSRFNNSLHSFIRSEKLI